MSVAYPEWGFGLSQPEDIIPESAVFSVFSESDSR